MSFNFPRVVITECDDGAWNNPTWEEGNFPQSEI